MTRLAHFALHYSTLVLLSIAHSSCALSFEWAGAGDPNFAYDGDASQYGPNEVKLTLGVADATFHPSSGRMRYAHPISLCSTSVPASFNTSFTFDMSLTIPDVPAYRGDGITFFISPVGALPAPPLPTTKGLFGGLFGNSSASSNPSILAVEFDSSRESWDPNDNHVGVDLGSVVSVHTAALNASGIVLTSGRTIQAWIEYKGKQGVLNVYASYSDGQSGVHPVLLLSVHKLRLCTLLKHRSAIVGFSSASRGSVETHDLFSWSWQSS